MCGEIYSVLPETHRQCVMGDLWLFGGLVMVIWWFPAVLLMGFLNKLG